MMISMDDPEHHRRRRPSSTAGSPPAGSVSSRTTVADDLSARILDGCARRELATSCGTSPHRCRCWSSPTCSGFDEPHHDDLLRWSDDLLRATTSDPDRRTWQTRGASRRCSGSGRCSSQVIDERRADARDDLISILCVAARSTGIASTTSRSSRDACCCSIGGDETTRHVISGGMLALLQHPAQWEALVDRPRSAPGRGRGAAALGLAGEEHVAHGHRPTSSFGASTCAAGDQVMLFYPSANRDETVFATARRARHPARPEPAPRVRLRPALLPRGVAGPPRAPGHVPRDVLDRLPGSAAAPAPTRCPYAPVELRERPRGDAGAVRVRRPRHVVSGPLDGVRVVELGVWVAGPGVGGILADWGADVTKIEPPTGDPARSFQRMIGGDLDVNPVFELDNRGKRSIVLDLSDERGVERRPPAARRGRRVRHQRPRRRRCDRLGLGPDDVAARHPQLVYAVISGYGLDGPDADQGGLTTSPRTGPVPASPSRCERPAARCRSSAPAWATTRSAMTGAAMMSAALVRASAPGEDRWCRRSLLRQGAYTIGFDVNVALMWGRTIAGRASRETMHSPTVNNYTAGDGRSVLDRRASRASATGRRWREPSGAPEWITDDRVRRRRGAERVNAPALIARARRDLRHPSPRRVGRGLRRRAGTLLEPGEQHRGPARRPAVPRSRWCRRRARRGRQPAPMLATPADFDGATPAPRWRAPGLGEHTREVLAELGFDAAEVDAAAARRCRATAAGGDLTHGCAAPGSRTDGRHARALVRDTAGSGVPIHHERVDPGGDRLVERDDLLRRDLARRIGGP